MRTVPGELVVIGLSMATGIVLLSGGSVSASTTPEVCFTFDPGTKTITDYEALNGPNNCSRDVIVPATIGGVVVEAVGDSSFRDKSLTTVVLPNSLQIIGDDAFSWNYLTSIAIPSGIETIPAYAFEANQLSTVTLPDSLLTIKNNAFGINRITSINLPASIVEIGAYAFYGNRLTSITLPTTLLRLDAGAFAYNKIQQVSLPSQLAYTGYDSDIFWELPIPEVYLSAQAFEGQSDNQDAGYTTMYVGKKIFPNCETLDNEYLDQITNKSSRLMCEELLATRFWYVQVRTSPGNPNQYPDHAGIRTDSSRAIVGGHIVNPAVVNITYLDQNGTTILSPVTTVGMREGGKRIADFYVDNGPIIPVPADPYFSTAGEQQAVDFALEAYFRVGDSWTFSPGQISGYVSPGPRSVPSLNTVNDVAFVYQRALRAVSFPEHTIRDGSMAPSSVPVGISSKIIVSSSLAIGRSDNSDSPECDTITSANLLAPTTINNPSSSVTILGGLQFVLSCAVNGETKIAYTLGSRLVDRSKLHVYKRNNVKNTIEDITDRVSVSAVEGKTVITYSIIDGGSFDEDGQANGVIVDPIYVGLSNDAFELAATGTDATSFVVGATSLVGVGVSIVVYLLYRARQMRQ